MNTRSASIREKLAGFVAILVLAAPALANPPNGKVVFQAFWWDCLNRSYQTDADGTGGWYTYLAKLSPRLRDLGFDGIWVPAPAKGAGGRKSMGYDVFDHYDLGHKFQKDTVGTRFGSLDDYLRLIAVAHACGLEVYADIVLNHMTGGEIDPQAPGDTYKTFRYRSFSGPTAGRWPKSWLDFHPNPHHSAASDDWRIQLFGPDICYRGRCCDNACDQAGTYMRDQAREWFVWLRKQTDVDGFRFDAVKHFPPEVVEDLLFNAMHKDRPIAEQRSYFAVGELVVGKHEQSRIDQWATETQNRCGTFDFALREALFEVVTSRGAFDLGSLPNFQQQNRLKTVPFINNHDTFRGVFSDSSGNGKGDHTGHLKNGDELVATIDPDDPWSKVAYAAAFAVDGSPQVYYEDLFRNNDPTTREQANPQSLATRDYVENLVWCHQKLDFKDGAYLVRFQGSSDLLVIERSGKAVIALNDHGEATLPGTPLVIQTNFGPNVALHDYSGSTSTAITTDAQGRIAIQVPPKTYCVWAPAGAAGGFAGHPRRTTQEFQLSDDLGDSAPETPRYGGDLVTGAYRNAGAIWVKQGSAVNVTVTTPAPAAVDLRILKPATTGANADSQGQHATSGITPISFQFVADREGYHQLTARLAPSDAAPMRAAITVNYEAPAESELF